jgi:endonuclease III
MPKRVALGDAIRKLEGLYGKPAPPEVTDPYEMTILENVAYLVDDARRAATFSRLKKEIGLRPSAILAVPDQVLADVIRNGGMLAAHRARKVKRCAALAEEIEPERLRKVVREDPKAARRLLKRFPGIADPGADRILLYAGGHRLLGPDSNALRVLHRLGFGRQEKDYGRTYRSVLEAAETELPRTAAAMVRMRQLLRRHGKEICRSSAPRCGACPLRSVCWYYQRLRD